MDDGVMFKDRLQVRDYLLERYGVKLDAPEFYDAGTQVGVCVYKGDRANPEFAHCVRQRLPADLWNDLAHGLIEWLNARSLP